MPARWLQVGSTLKVQVPMAKLLFIILLFFGYLGFGQDSYPTKSELFKSLTKETKLKRKVYNSTNWFTVQNDSSYQSADTLYFYNNQAFRYEEHFCEFVDWNFYKKDAFWMQRIQLCKEQQPVRQKRKTSSLL